jgi:hypothetical protein
MSGLDPIVAATMVQRVADRAAIPTSVPTATYGPQGPFAPGQSVGDTSAQSHFSSTASTSTLSDLARLLDVLARAGGGVAPPVTNGTPLIAQPWPDSLANASSNASPGSAPDVFPAAAAAPVGAAAAAGSPRVGEAASSDRSDPTARLALALSAALEDSGLFYEAHLAQWLAGTRSTESVLRQPQARLLPTLPPTTAAAATAHAPPAPVAPARAGVPSTSVDWILEDDLPITGLDSVASSPGVARGNEALARVLDTPRQTYAFWNAGGGYAHPSAHGPSDGLGGGEFASHGAALQGDALDTSSSGSGSDNALTTFLLPAVMHPDAVGLVQQQLDLLSTSQFRWAGEAWPGMRFEWSVEPYDADDAQRAGAERSWRTRVRLSLPELGHLEADLILAGDALHARLESPADVTPVLSAGSEAFRDRLALSGIRLSGLTISGRQDVGDDAAPWRPGQRGWR